MAQGDPDSTVALAPCPSCGHCPTCGHGGPTWPVYPTYLNYPWPQVWRGAANTPQQYGVTY